MSTSTNTLLTKTTDRKPTILMKKQCKLNFSLKKKTMADNMTQEAADESFENTEHMKKRLRLNVPPNILTPPRRKFQNLEVNEGLKKKTIAF